MLPLRGLLVRRRSCRVALLVLDGTIAAMNLLPSPHSSAAAQRMRRGVRRVGGWLGAHRALASWLVWGVCVLLCVAWVQRYYQPPAGPAWFGKTLRVTVFALVGLVIREWLALRWEDDRAPEQRPLDPMKDQDQDD